MGMLSTLKRLVLLLIVPGLVACSAPALTAPGLSQVSPLTQSASENPRLVAPLSQALNRALQDAEQARSPEEARQLAQRSFFVELERLLLRQLSSKEVQLQMQSQWTATGKIQLQLQAQISEQQITAQAQRQSIFEPRN